MKVNKTQGVLYLLTMLLSGKQLQKNSIKTDLEITDLTFKRYIQELRAFFVNFSLNYEIEYDREKMEYCLKKQ